MNNSIKFVFTFSLGAAAGAVVSWRYLKKKYEQITREEIASYKDACSSKRKDKETSDEKDEEVPERTKTEYRSLLEKLPYGEVKEEVAPAKEDGPYVIAPEDFDEYDDYETVSLTYYADGVLVSDDGEIIEDIEELIGRDSINRFGEYEDDSVYVRDERVKTDYEILKDYRKYTDVTKRACSSEMED